MVTTGISRRGWRSCEKAENSISGTMLNEFKRKGWGEEENWKGPRRLDGDLWVKERLRVQ